MTGGLEIDGDHQLLPLEPRHAGCWWDAFQDARARLVPWLGWASDVHTRDQAAQLVAARHQAGAAAGAPVAFGIWRCGPDADPAPAMVGELRLLKLDWRNEKCELQLWLRAGAEGTGLATRATRAFLAHAFSPGPIGLGLRRATMRVATGNARAKRWAEHVGFAHEGVIRETARVNDTWHDDNLYGLLRRDWQPRPPTG